MGSLARKFLISGAAMLGVSAVLGVLVEFSSFWGSVRAIDIAVVFWSFLTVLFLRNQMSRNWKLMVFAVLAGIWILGNSYLRGGEIFLAGLFLVRWSLYLWTAVTLSSWIQSESEYIQKWVDFVAAFWISIGVGQYLLFPDARILFWSGWDDHLFRAFGSVLDPLFYGLTSAVLAWRFWRRLEISPILYSSLLGLALVGSVLSYSRLALIGVAVWVALESLTVRRMRKFVFLGIVVTILTLIAPRDGGGEGQKLLRTSTLEARQESISQDISQSRSDWLFGNGWYFKPSTSLPGIPVNATTSDTFWLQMFLSGGVLGLGAVLVLGWYQKINSQIIWWHIILNVLTVASFSPWILLASAVVPIKFSQPKNQQ